MKGIRFLRKADYYDFHLLAVIIILVGFGLVMLYSTSSYVAGVERGNDMYYFTRQATILFASLAASVFLSVVVQESFVKAVSFMAYLASVVLMAMVRFTPFGVTRNAARRWLRLFGIEFQPSEIAKVAIIMFLPFVIISMRENANKWWGVMIQLFIGAVPSAAAFFLTDNLSTAIIIMAITCVIIFVAHPKTKIFVILFIIAAAAAGFLIWYLWTYGVSGGNFRASRILVWRNPEQYSDTGGYQILQALYAIGSGGFLGKGLGNSIQKLGWLPEAQNDMIFSIICEELGIFGGLIVIMLFVFLLYRLFFIAMNAQDRYETLLVTGIFGHIALQVILNISVVLNVIPTTGVTLPFISYGGTSVLFLILEMGLALMASRHIRLAEDRSDLWEHMERNRNRNKNAEITRRRRPRRNGKGERI